MPEPAPPDLRTLVEDSITPGVRLEDSGKSSDRDAWWFRLKWREQLFNLWVRDIWWKDQSNDYIALQVRVAAPAPEATLSGQRLWLRLIDVTESESVCYHFALLRELEGQEGSALVKITRTARKSLHNTAVTARRVLYEFELSAAIVALKDQIDIIDDGHEIEVNSENVNVITKRERSTDQAIRDYVGSRLYHAYQSSSLAMALVFNKHDLDYLGVSEKDFQRAASLAEGEDWDHKELTFRPRREFLKRFERSAATVPSGGQGQPDAASAGSARRTVFICHAEADKTIAAVLKDYVETASPPVDAFAASHPKSLTGGDEWWKKIHEALVKAAVVLTLFSPRSKDRPWLYFESGGAYFKEKLVIPLTVPPERKSIPPPLGVLQALDLGNREDVKILRRKLGEKFSVTFAESHDTLWERLQTAFASVSPQRIAAPSRRLKRKKS